MYTQCPDCDTAFRVTAPDLQRASGRVVCIGCSREFNALERLSEDPPATEERADEKRAILESLNELTGPHEIRIEDTGVEWRVVDEDELAEEEPSPPVESASDGDEDSSIRWYIADLADELASDDTAPDDAVAETPEPGPGAGPAPESNDSAALEPSPGEHKISILQESLELPATVSDGDVQRYDDNTPLPDDFADEGEPRVPQRRAEDRIEPRSPEADEAQVDLALGEPEEWMELLGEVGPTADGAIPRSAGLAPADRALSSVDTLAGTDVRPVSDDEPLLDDGYPSDIDTQFDLQAIELGIDLTGSRNLSLEDEAEEHDEPLRLETDEPEGDVAVTREQDLATAQAPQDEQLLPTAPPAIAVEDPPVGAAAVEAEEWPGPPESTTRREDEDEEDVEERTREEAFELELAAAYSITPDDKVDGGPDDPAQTGPVVPPATEEEMTINMMIDQDLIRLADQQNVFTSTAARRKPDVAPHVETIIMEGEFVRSVLDGDEESSRDPGAGAFAGPDGRMPAQPDYADLTLKAHSKSKDRVRGGRRGADSASYSVMAGVAVLGLVLAAQVVHAYRNTLATYPIFDSTVGSVYRLLGEPVVPGWNVTEWRFEATSGSTDDTDEVLTISSRIANGSAKPLPYPLLHVSLTDRWEEIIGSKVLEPAEYLAGSADAAARVSPGEKFTAVIRVEAPAPEATGFKLNVCYPDNGDRVRCATEDFR